MMMMLILTLTLMRISDIVEHVAALAALIQCPASVDGFCSLLGEYARRDAAGSPPVVSGSGAAEEGTTHGEVYSCYGDCGLRRIWHALRQAGATTRGAGLCTTASGRSAAPDNGARSVASWRILFLAVLDQGHLVHGGRRVSGPL